MYTPYTVEEVLANIDSRIPAIIAAGVIIFIGAYMQYIEAVRLGFKHRSHAIPIFANMYFFAHDILFVSLYHHWFHEIDHWLFKLFWVAVIPFIFFECIIHYQVLRYSRQEVFPYLNQRQALMAYVAMQLGVAVLVCFIDSLITDPLFLTHFAITEIISNVWSIPMVLSRRSRKGQSLLLAVGLLLGSNVGYFFLFLPLLSPAFTTGPYLMMGAAVTVLNLFYMFLLLKHPPYQAAQASHSSVSAAQPA